MLSAQDPKFWETICNWLSLGLVPPPRLSPGKKEVKIIPHLLAVWDHHVKWNGPFTKNTCKREEVISLPPFKMAVRGKAGMDVRLQVTTRYAQPPLVYLFRILKGNVCLLNESNASSFLIVLYWFPWPTSFGSIQVVKMTLSHFKAGSFWKYKF